MCWSMSVESDIVDFISSYMHVYFSYIKPSPYCLKMKMFLADVAHLKMNHK